MQVLRGKVVSGSGKAAFFTQLDWVREQCNQKLGFEPFPGTLNIEIFPGTPADPESLRSQKGIELIPADPSFCIAKVVRASIRGIDAAIVIPEKNVGVHGDHTLEVLAPVRLKTALGINDGDTVEITIKSVD